MNEKIPQRSSCDENHPQVSETKCCSIHDHPNQRHEVDCQRRLPGENIKKKNNIKHDYQLYDDKFSLCGEFLYRFMHT